MSTILTIKLPIDFEEKYKAYKAKVLGQNNPHTHDKQGSEVGEVKKFPYSLPSGTMWENFIIKFLDDDRVLISVRGKEVEADFKEMRFEDKRNGKPDSQWAFLRILSKNAGEIDWNTSDAEDKFKKSKERLTNQLQAYFGIDYDPFQPYQNTKSYKIKITLVPPPEIEMEEKKDTKKDLHEEIQEMFSGLIEDQ